MGSAVIGDLVVQDTGGGEFTPTSRFTYSEKFNELFPYYLSIGMTYEQFWEQDCTLVAAYRKANKIKRDVDNQHLWLQGLYFYEALCCASPILTAFPKKGAKPTPYRSEPYPLEAKSSEGSKESKQELNDGKAKAFMEMYMLHNNKQFEVKGGNDG